MSPDEFWHLYEFKRPRKQLGKLSETDADRLLAKLERAEGAQRGSTQ